MRPLKILSFLQVIIRILSKGTGSKGEINAINVHLENEYI